MRNIKMPADPAGWEHLAGALVKAELKLAGMSYRDLQSALLSLGVEQSTANISLRLNLGRFPASFLLQALVAIGAEDIQLPRRALGSATTSGASHPER